MSSKDNEKKEKLKNELLMYILNFSFFVYFTGLLYIEYSDTGYMNFLYVLLSALNFQQAKKHAVAYFKI